MIAALFVVKDGPYIGLPDIDPWTKERDARLYPGRKKGLLLSLSQKRVVCEQTKLSKEEYKAAWASLVGKGMLPKTGLKYVESPQDLT